MDVTTVLVVVGGVVVVKTSAIAVLVARRDRRQRRRVDTAVTAARRVDPSGWGLMWAEPGVLLVTNTARGSAARDVELSASLTTSAGATSSLRHDARFVGSGASVELRFGALVGWLGEAAAPAWGTAQGAPRELRELLSCTLTYSIRWRAADGEPRVEERTAQPVLPVPDLALGPA